MPRGLTWKLLYIGNEKVLEVVQVLSTLLDHLTCSSHQHCNIGDEQHRVIPVTCLRGTSSNAAAIHATPLLCCVPLYSCDQSALYMIHYMFQKAKTSRSTVIARSIAAVPAPLVRYHHWTAVQQKTFAYRSKA